MAPDQSKRDLWEVVVRECEAMLVGFESLCVPLDISAEAMPSPSNRDQKMMPMNGQTPIVSEVVSLNLKIHRMVRAIAP
jgi:hypothetical protein